MSYDLYFRTKTQPLSLQTFERYFKRREQYKCDGAQAIYENEKTGVYFMFNHSNGEAEDADEDSQTDLDPAGTVSANVAFNLNYLRPQPFAWEALSELIAFVEEFGLTVYDPQRDGIGFGPFDTSGFLRGWNSGNEFAYGAVLRHEDFALSSYAVLPEGEIERIWNWNRNVEEYQLAHQSVFVPRISFAKTKKGIFSFIVWGDMIPIALPPVDKYLLIRREMKNLPEDGSQDDRAFIDSEKLKKSIEHLREDTDAGCRLLEDPGIQRQLYVDFLNAPTMIEELEGHPFGRILSRELVDRFGKKQQKS